MAFKDMVVHIHPTIQGAPTFIMAKDPAGDKRATESASPLNAAYWARATAIGSKPSGGGQAAIDYAARKKQYDAIVSAIRLGRGAKPDGTAYSAAESMTSQAAGAFLYVLTGTNTGAGQGAADRLLSVNETNPDEPVIVPVAR